jgi:hypothetical protein
MICKIITYMHIYKYVFYGPGVLVYLSLDFGGSVVRWLQIFDSAVYIRRWKRKCLNL